jgi:hypothetical protein
MSSSREIHKCWYWNDTGVKNTFFFVNIEVRVAQWVRSLDLTAHTSLSPIRCVLAASFVNYKKGCTRLAAASEKVYQLLSQGWWFSPGTPASSTTKNWSPWYNWNTAESGAKTQLINQSIFVNKKLLLI